MSDAPAAFYRDTVAPEWIDYNGHMNVAYYVLAFDRGTDRLLDHLGLGEAYRRTSGHSIFVLEAHVTYERELKAGDPIAVTTQLIDADHRRLHLFHRLYHDGAGYLAATNELLALHVDLAGPQAADMPADAQAAVARLAAAHRGLPPPTQLGRRIGLNRSPSTASSRPAT